MNANILRALNRALFLVPQEFTENLHRELVVIKVQEQKTAK